MAVPHLTVGDQIIITGFERYQITVALAAFAFLANHTSHLLPVAIDHIARIDHSDGPH